MIYIFDIDGTLTPHRKAIMPIHKIFFKDFISRNRVVLVTGSDRSKSVEQLGEEILQNVESVFNCGGNVGEANGVVFHERDITVTEDLNEAIDDFIENSQFPERLGNHVEPRVGMINISSIGRNASHAQRKQYFEWDEIVGERQAFCDKFNSNFKDYEASVGGMISIDIIEKGFDKSQILDHMDDYTVFFGDNIKSGGNDLSIAMASDIAFKVNSPEETFDILKKIFS